MNLDVFQTHMELYPYAKDDYPVIENMYTAKDNRTQMLVPCGYILEDGKLFLPRGTSISKLEHVTGTKANYDNDIDPSESMSKQFYSAFEPRDQLQEDSIKFLIEDDNAQLGLNLATGKGKTYCVAYASTKLKKKTIIITPNEGLKQQWISTYLKMFEYKDKNLLNISGSSVIDGIMDDTIDPVDVYFVNHQTLRSYMTYAGGYGLHKFFKKIKCGIKVYDESHLEFANILLVDFFSNTERTWYLTATFDRSDKSESACFKRAFSTVNTFGEYESKEVTKKHVIYHVVNINSRISPYDRAKVIGYSGMSAHSYGRYAFIDDKNQTAYRAILKILNLVKDSEGKILIFVPLISVADDIVAKLSKDFPDKTVGAYHSKMNKEDKEVTLTKKDIIVSTIKSCGTGKDIPGLRSVICAEPVASKVVAEQMFGRLRPYAEDKSTYFFDILDVSIPPIIWWYKARFKKIQTLAKEVVRLNLDK